MKEYRANLRRLIRELRAQGDELEIKLFVAVELRESYGVPRRSKYLPTCTYTRPDYGPTSPSAPSESDDESEKPE